MIPRATQASVDAAVADAILGDSNLMDNILNLVMMRMPLNISRKQAEKHVDHLVGSTFESLRIGELVDEIMEDFRAQHNESAGKISGDVSSSSSATSADVSEVEPVDDSDTMPVDANDAGSREASSHEEEPAVVPDTKGDGVSNIVEQINAKLAPASLEADTPDKFEARRQQMDVKHGAWSRDVAGDAANTSLSTMSPDTSMSRKVGLSPSPSPGGSAATSSPTAQKSSPISSPQQSPSVSPGLPLMQSPSSKAVASTPASASHASPLQNTSGQDVSGDIDTISELGSEPASPMPPTPECVLSTSAASSPSSPATTSAGIAPTQCDEPERLTPTSKKNRKKRAKARAKLAALRSRQEDEESDSMEMSMDSGVEGMGSVASPGSLEGSLTPARSLGGGSSGGGIDFNKTSTFRISSSTDGIESVEVIPTSLSNADLPPLSPNMSVAESSMDYADIQNSSFSPEAASRAVQHGADPPASAASASPGDALYEEDDFEQEEPGDDRPRVRFAQRIVSDTRYYDRYSRNELGDIFWSHEDANRFHIEYDRELRRALEEGLEWKDWINNRTDEDIAREEEIMADQLSMDDYGDDYVDEVDDMEMGLNESFDDDDNQYAFE